MGGQKNFPWSDRRTLESLVFQVMFSRTRVSFQNGTAPSGIGACAKSARRGLDTARRRYTRHTEDNRKTSLVGGRQEQNIANRRETSTTQGRDKDLRPQILARHSHMRETSMSIDKGTRPTWLKHRHIVNDEHRGAEDHTTTQHQWHIDATATAADNNKNNEADDRRRRHHPQHHHQCPCRRQQVQRGRRQQLSTQEHRNPD